MHFPFILLHILQSSYKPVNNPDYYPIPRGA